MMFFEPYPEFVDWLAAHAGSRLIVDMGCGTGSLLAAYWKLGSRENIVGVDPRFFALVDEEGRLPNLPVHRVLPQYGQDCELARMPNLLVVFARPCHNGFVTEVIDVLHPTSEVLYISKPSNCGLDLFGGTYSALDTPTPGREGERVYRVTHHASEEAHQPRQTSARRRVEEGLARHERERRDRRHHRGRGR